MSCIEKKTFQVGLCSEHGNAMLQILTCGKAGPEAADALPAKLPESCRCGFRMLGRDAASL